MPSREKKQDKLEWFEYDYRFSFDLLTPYYEDLPRSELIGFSIPSEQKLRRILARPVLLVFGTGAYVLQFHSWGTLKFSTVRVFPRNTLARVRISDIEGKPRRQEVNPYTGLLPPLGISQSRAGVFFIYGSRIEMMDWSGMLYECDPKGNLH